MKLLLNISIIFYFIILVIANLPDGVHVVSDIDSHFDPNAENDYDSFFREKESSKFNTLTPQDSIKKLSEIFDKIDSDHDGKVSTAELKHWIKAQSQKLLREEANKTWSLYVGENDKLSFASYKDGVYYDDTSKDTIARDERRWTTADKDGDTLLTKEEFFKFLHPEENEDMRDLVIQETMEELDKNKDGLVDANEYIADLWLPQKTGEEEPDWVKAEREQFAKVRDLNKDGVLDLSEIGDWILPEDNQETTETNHLMLMTDTDKDGWLTKEEVVARYDVFKGSQATDFGEDLGAREEL